MIDCAPEEAVEGALAAQIFPMEESVDSIEKQTIETAQSCAG